MIVEVRGEGVSRAGTRQGALLERTTCLPCFFPPGVVMRFAEPLFAVERGWMVVETLGGGPGYFTVTTTV